MVNSVIDTEWPADMHTFGDKNITELGDRLRCFPAHTVSIDYCCPPWAKIPLEMRRNCSKYDRPSVTPRARRKLTDGWRRTEKTISLFTIFVSGGLITLTLVMLNKLSQFSELTDHRDCGQSSFKVHVSHRVFWCVKRGRSMRLLRKPLTYKIYRPFVTDIYYFMPDSL